MHCWERLFCASDRIYDLTGEEYQQHAVELAESAAANSIPFLDLTASLREREAGERMNLLYDGHFQVDTYIQAGEHIFNSWASLF